jgi:hypothetical protein
MLTLRRFAAAVIAWSILETLVVWIVDPLRSPLARSEPVGLVVLGVLLIAGLALLLAEAGRWWRGGGPTTPARCAAVAR